MRNDDAAPTLLCLCLCSRKHFIDPFSSQAAAGLTQQILQPCLLLTLCPLSHSHTLTHTHTHSHTLTHIHIYFITFVCSIHRHRSTILLRWEKSCCYMVLCFCEVLSYLLSDRNTRLEVSCIRLNRETFFSPNKPRLSLCLSFFLSFYFLRLCVCAAFSRRVAFVDTTFFHLLQLFWQQRPPLLWITFSLLCCWFMGKSGAWASIFRWNFWGQEEEILFFSLSRARALN